MSGYEQQLLTRAEVLEDTGELVDAVIAVLTSAQGAGVDPAAAASLVAAARALNPAAGTGYDTGRLTDRRPGGGYRSDGEFLEAVSDAEDDARDRLREVQQLHERVSAAADAARDDLAQARFALAAAYALPVKDRCDGCHEIKQAAIMAAEAAIADAQCRIGLCMAAAEILDPLAQRLAAALSRLRQVPADLGEVYQLVYDFIRKGGKLPAYGRWLEGSSIRLPTVTRNFGGPHRLPEDLPLSCATWFWPRWSP